MPGLRICFRALCALAFPLMFVGVAKLIVQLPSASLLITVLTLLELLLVIIVTVLAYLVGWRGQCAPTGR